MNPQIPPGMFCPYHIIHPHTAFYLGHRQSVQRNLVVMWVDLLPCQPAPEIPLTAYTETPTREL